MEDVGRQRAYPPYPWPHLQPNKTRTSSTTVAWSIVGSLCLVALAVFIQSLDLPYIRSIIKALPGRRRSLGPIDGASSRGAPTRSQSQSSSKAKTKQNKANKPRKVKDKDRAHDTSTTIQPTDSSRQQAAAHRSQVRTFRAKSTAAPKPTSANPRKRQQASPAGRIEYETAGDKDTKASELGAARPAGPTRGLSYSNILSPILNPRAAAYEFRAQYSSTPPAGPAVVEASSSVPEVLPTPVPAAFQPFDAILVIDVEATCATGSSFDYPNEIIEWPVVLMRWTNRDEPTGLASELVVVDEFRTFVRPTWRPLLTEFCTSLTGITQTEVDTAPDFVEMLNSFEVWLRKHDLIPQPSALLTPPSTPIMSSSPPLQPTAEPFVPSSPVLLHPRPVASPLLPQHESSLLSPPLSPATSFAALASNSTSTSFSGFAFPSPSNLSPDSQGDTYYPEGEMYYPGGTRFAWATDGPFDLRDFLVKQCFISKIPVPEYFLGEVIDVKKVVGSWSSVPAPSKPFVKGHAKRQSLTIPLQLQALSLGKFSGQQHRGIDDARNISRILQALAKEGVSLEGNMYVNPNRSWHWMGGDGEVVLPPTPVG